MKTNRFYVVAKNELAFCQRFLALFLAAVMLCNTGAYALEGVSPAKHEIADKIRAQMNQTQQSQSPQQFLKQLRQKMEDLLSDSSTEQNPFPAKYTFEQYRTKYQHEMEQFYARQERQIAKEAEDSLAEFDQAAQAERDKYDMQQMLLVGAYLRSEREKYIKEINAWKEKIQAELNEEKAQQMQQVSEKYAQYQKGFDAAIKEAEAAQLEFYRDLVTQVVEKYKQTRDNESKENFVSLATFFSSFSNKDQIITKENKEFIRKALYSNFTVAKHACAGGMVTEYEGSWGSTGMLASGSPSAGRSFDVGTNKRQVFKLADEEKCNLAISSLIPFANLNGDGYAITNFMQSYFDNPMFGQILLVGTKALLLTHNRNMEALVAFIDKAIAKENSGRKKTFWQSLDVITFEGMSRNLLSAFTGNYFAHNVSSSAQRGTGEPNVWEDVAQMLAQQHTQQADAILSKAVAQCTVRMKGQYPSATQQVGCEGIYPFLFGVLVHKPALAAKLRVDPGPDTAAGQTFDKNGNVHYVTEAQAARNRAYYDKIDITKKYTREEMLGRLLYNSFFEDVYPKDKQRMDSLLANNATLNPKGGMEAYSEHSERYKKLVNRYNRNVVVVALGSVVDYIVMILMVKDLGLLVMKLGAFVKGTVTLAKGASSAMKVRHAILSYRMLPGNATKSVQIALLDALRTQKLTVGNLRSYKQFTVKINNIKTKAQKIQQFKTNVITRFRQANAPRFHFENPVFAKAARGADFTESVFTEAAQGTKFTGAAQGTQFAGAPFAGAATAGFVYEEPLITGIGDSAGVLGQKIKLGGKKLAAGIKKIWDETVFAKKIWQWASPWKKAAPTDATTLDASKLTVKGVFRKEPITEIKITKDMLYINGEMAKTYKAFLPLNQLEPLAALAKEQKMALGFDGLWVKLVDPSAKFSKWERISSLNKTVKTVPLFDGAGAELLQVGLNPGYKAQASLLTRIQNGARLVFTDGKIHLSEGGVLKTLNGVDRISIPKTAVSNAVRTQNTRFLTGLFALPDKGLGALYLEQTKSKLLWPMFINLLSFSAASSSLMMTLEQEPFNLSSAESIAVGLGLPYASALATPFLTPFVKRFGARNVMVGSLMLATGSLGVAMANGYYGKPITRDEDGNLSVPVWPLYLTAGLTGLASTGIRASSNIVIKGYELNQRTMTISMLAKSVGAMAMTAIPAAFLLGGKDVDFSIAYPFLAGLSLVTTGGLLYTMPKLADKGYKFTRSAFFSPWKFLAKKDVWPYVGGIALMSSLEGYVYFKGVSALDRDIIQNGFDTNKTYAKFWASLATAIPQGVLRWRSPRQALFGRGLVNSALLAGVGTVALMLPTEDWSLAGNVAIGLLSGTLIGLGTAQVYQYNQKLFTEAIGIKYGKNMVPSSQVLYSMGNLGLALPAVFGFAAQNRKEEYGENDFFSTQRTFHLPLMAYGAGLGLIAMAEHNAFSKIPSALNIAGRWAKLAVPVVGASKISTELSNPTTLKAPSPISSFEPFPNGLKLSPAKIDLPKQRAVAVPPAVPDLSTQQE
ncbi:MAG: hypothetical protein IKO35_06715 [Elusimicrobiaceae bacterium]|nr:hypothetical protein [Elusimicrobiaceae bacterium]